MCWQKDPREVHWCFGYDSYYGWLLSPGWSSSHLALEGGITEWTIDHPFDTRMKNVYSSHYGTYPPGHEMNKWYKLRCYCQPFPAGERMYYHTHYYLVPEEEADEYYLSEPKPHYIQTDPFNLRFYVDFEDPFEKYGCPAR